MMDRLMGSVERFEGTGLWGHEAVRNLFSSAGKLFANIIVI
jgi:hypothetical protein